jgi:hypothetical protein
LLLVASANLKGKKCAAHAVFEFSCSSDSSPAAVVKLALLDFSTTQSHRIPQLELVPEAGIEPATKGL